MHFERYSRFPVRDDFCTDLNRLQTGPAAVYLRENMEDRMENDLISRSALLEKATNVTKYDEGGWCMVLKAVSVEDVLKAPAVDAVEVCRCKDCKHFYEPDINPNRRCKRGGSQVWDVEFTEDDFCSYGERGADECTKN